MSMEYRNGVLHIGGVSAIELIQRFGSPLYVYDAAIVDRQIGRLEKAFSGMPLMPFYAMKANSNIAILRRIRQRGLGCDAVSPGEVFLARAAGFDPKRIWFTCSNVSDPDLQQLGSEEMVVNINSVAELDRCIRLGIRNPIAIRINPAVGAGHHRDVVTAGFGVKFGIDLAELDTARIIATDNDVDIVGLHYHIGSGVTEPTPLLEAARVLLEVSRDFPHVQWLNFGGGMSVPYRPGEAEFPIDEYGSLLTEIAAGELNRRGLRAIIEPGRYTIAQSGALLATVTTRKIASGFEWLGCDTGFNHLVRPSKYGAYHHILNASRGSNEWLRENFDAAAREPQSIVAGNLCESGDVFTRTGDDIKPRALPPTHQGDVIAFCDAGAYGFSMASHYNARLLPAEVLVENGAANLVRKRQEMQSLMEGQ